MPGDGEKPFFVGVQSIARRTSSRVAFSKFSSVRGRPTLSIHYQHSKKYSAFLDILFENWSKSIMAQALVDAGAKASLRTAWVRACSISASSARQVVISDSTCTMMSVSVKRAYHPCAGLGPGKRIYVEHPSGACDEWQGRAEKFPSAQQFTVECTKPLTADAGRGFELYIASAAMVGSGLEEFFVFFH